MADFQTPPSYSSNQYATDKTVGIVVMVLSLCSVIGGGLMMAGGGLLAATGTGAAATAGTTEAATAAGGAGFVGMIVGLLGVILIISGLVNFASGFGIMKSRRWGFILGAVVFGINVLLSLLQLPKGILGLLIGGALLYYCIARLTGKMGPVPT